MIKSSHSVDVDIRVNDKTLKLYPHNGRVFVEAKHGSEYTIKIKNNGWKRVLAVVTVDGQNVIDGQAGGESKNGYVINGYSSYEVKGWRTSSDNVNAFKFGSKKRSYAAKSEVTGGDTANCGVIAVEIYDEKEKPQPQILIREVIREVDKPRSFPGNTPWQPWNNPQPTWTGSPELICGGLTDNTVQTFNCSCSSLGSDAPLMMNMMADGLDRCGAPEKKKINFDMGTEWSKKEINDKVTEVEFETGLLLTTFSFYYASHNALLDMGVPLEKKAQVTFPNPFPSKFCKPPTR